MPHARQQIDVRSVEGRLRQLIYSPKGGIEGVLIDTNGIAAQFVFDSHDPQIGDAFAVVRPGQTLVVEGIEQGPTPKGKAFHAVYAFERLVSVDAVAPKVLRAPEGTQGKVARFNYARHGEANGVVLDNGDFVHTRPDGLKRLALKVGDKVNAAGRARALATGNGRVIEAHAVNGKPIGAGHG